MKKIAIIGASFGQEPLCRKAMELGMETYCFAWAKGALCKDIVNHFYSISIYDTDEIVRICREEKIDGVVTNASDQTALAASLVAERLELNGTKYDVLLSLQDKYTVRSLTKKIEGLDAPRFYHYKGVDEGLYPCVVKPCRGGGKTGVSFVENASDLCKAMGYAAEAGKDDMLVEEYVSGKELSVESISYHGEHYVLQITDKDSSSAPHFVELGHHQPAQLPMEVREKIHRVVPRLLTAIGYTDGASHIEMKYDGEKLFLIEVNLRGGGGQISNRLVLLSTGIDYLKCMIDVALDTFEKPEPLASPAYAGVYFLCRQTARLLPFFENAKGKDWLVEEEIANRQLQESHTNHERDGYLIYRSDHKITPKEIAPPTRITYRRINGEASAYSLLCDFVAAAGKPRTENFMTSLRKNLELGDVFVCCHGERVIGMINVYCNNTETKEAYICNVEVLKEYRGQRISKRLMADALSLVADRRFTSTFLYVDANNAIARHLYESEGFVLTGKEKTEGNKTLLEMRRKMT